MKKTGLFIIATVLMSGCKTLNSSTFRTGEVDYDGLTGIEEITETRLYIKQGPTCDIKSLSSNTLPAIAVPILGYVTKEAIAYGKDKIDKYAEYLNSDVKLNASSIVSFDGHAWPTDSLVSKLQTEKEATISAKLVDLVAEYEENHSVAKDSQALSKYRSEQRAHLEAEAAAPYKVEMASTTEDLCLLVVAGKFNGKQDDTKHRDIFVAKGHGLATPIDSYKMVFPGAEKNGQYGAMRGLSEDPSFVAEIQVVATDLGDKMQYVVRPTNIFYPYPLHKYTKSDLERKLTIELTFGAHKAAVSLDAIKGGTVLNGDILASKYSMFEAPKTERYKAVSVMVSEGPDQLPTAKLLTEISSHDKDLEKYLIEKISELATEKGAATEAAKQ